MDDTVIFIDSGFLSKLSKYFGKGKYLTYDLIKFSELLCKKQKLNCNKIFYYTAPPFQSDNPTKEEKERKDRYDTFIKKLSQNSKINVREGRCQKLVYRNGHIKFGQKAVDPLMIIDLMALPLKNKNIKKIVLIACDSDFVPVIEQLKELGIETILYTYFTKRRNTNFSRSNNLLKVVSKYVLLTKEDFLNSPLHK